MRQLVYTEPGHVRWEEAPEPQELAHDAALVRPLAVARCDLDSPMVAWGMFPGPFPVGHEIAAELVAVGEGVTHHRTGDRVVVAFQVSCGECRECATRRFAACRTHHSPAGAAFGFGPAGGGHGGGVADVLVVPHADHLLFPAPPSLSPGELCVLPDNVVDGYRTVAGPLAADPEADVLIVAGAAASVGLYAAASALALGASRVRYVDTDLGRCAAADAAGVEVEHVSGEWPRRFERASITVAYDLRPEALLATITSTAAYGTCTSAAIHLQPTELPLLQMYTRGITFHTSRADSRRYLPEVLELAGSRRLDISWVPSTIARLDDAEGVWLDAPHKLILTTS